VKEYSHDGFVISTDPARVDLDAIHRFLTRSYWAPGIPREIVARALANSLCFGLYEGKEQVGFARVISDRATYAYLADVYILETHRGRGLASRLVSFVMAHPELQGLRRWGLVTRDAHGLYRKVGFSELTRPEGYMEIVCPDVYSR